MANVVLEPQSMNLEEMLQAMRESVVKELGEEGRRNSDMEWITNRLNDLDQRLFKIEDNLRELAMNLGYVTENNYWRKIL